VSVPSTNRSVASILGEYRCRFQRMAHEQNLGNGTRSRPVWGLYVRVVNRAIYSTIAEVKNIIR
jgi:hypothetical protein